MDELRPEPPKDDPEALATWIWTAEDEKEIYEEGLAKALEETQGIAWAAGNIRIGELILIIDSDTRVPEDCFLDAAIVSGLGGPAYWVSTDARSSQRISQLAKHRYHPARIGSHASRRPFLRKRNHILHHANQFRHLLLRCKRRGRSVCRA